MKPMLKLRKRRYLAPVSIFLIVTALVAGFAGCGDRGIVEYTLTIASTSGGSVTLPGEGIFVCDEGTIASLVAEAEAGYHFVNWTGDVDTIANVNSAATTIIINDNCSITANFAGSASVQYDLTVTSTSGGSVVFPGEGTFPCDEGEVVPLFAEAAEGFYFVNWTGDVSAITDINSATTTITMYEDYSIMANFAGAPLVQYELTISSTSGGSVVAPGEGTYIRDEGTAVSLLAEAEEDYRFVSWTGDVATVGDVNTASTSITMNDHYSISANFEEDEVHFPDPNLEAVIRNAISKPTDPIYPSDLEGLASLDAQGRDIVDLNGLEHCINLVWVALSNNQITDLSPLANLPHVYFLALTQNQISNMAPLTNLISLTTLWIGWNLISVIPPLDDLTNLTDLHLYGNQIDDILPLASLTKLEDLALDYNQISNILPLASLTGLEHLSLDSNQISDISPLVDNTGLGEGDYLFLQSNPLTSDSINVYIPELEARGVTVYY